MFVVGDEISIVGSQRGLVPSMGGGEYRHCILGVTGNGQTEYFLQLQLSVLKARVQHLL